MPANEIKALRQSGKLDEAHAMAKAEMEADPTNIWTKRNMSWVLYSQLDVRASNLSEFLEKLNELKSLELPDTEEMLFDNISIVISKAVRNLTKVQPPNENAIWQVFDAIKDLPIKRNSKWYSVLFQAFHRALKESPRYLEFADWWNYDNFRAEDFQKEKRPDGKEVMSLVEQGYITYAKHLLPKQHIDRAFFDEERARTFIKRLDNVINLNPNYQYPPYYKAKLLLAFGERDNMLSALLPFARKRRNDFWVWDVFAEAFEGDEDKVFACYCRALSCVSPEEMLVSLRQRMAAILVKNNLYNEAKTEIELLIHARKVNGWKIPSQVESWKKQEWYQNAEAKGNNVDLYRKHADKAEQLLYTDLPEQNVLVTFVNKDAKILNFIGSDEQTGFFKYDRFISDVKVGDTLKARIKNVEKNGLCHVYTVTRSEDEQLKRSYMIDFVGDLRIPEGKPFGFVNEIFVHPALISKQSLVDGSRIKGTAIKTYNTEKQKWGWKMLG